MLLLRCDTLKSTHVLLAKASPIVMSDFKGVGKYNMYPKGEENQKFWPTAEMSTVVRYHVPNSWASRLAHSSWFAQDFYTFSAESPMSPQS